LACLPSAWQRVCAQRDDRHHVRLRYLPLLLFLAAAPGVMAAPVHKASSAIRIWYPADNYPQLVLPGGRQEVVRSILNITKPMHFGDFVWNEDRIPAGSVWVRVDLTRADPAELRQVVTEAWRRTAPKRVVKAYDSAQG